MILHRTYHKHYTEGTIELPGGVAIKTLELPWRNNQIGKSCIPEGAYKVTRDKTGRQQWYRLQDDEVSPRSAIEIHPANFLRHLQGCIAPCLDVKGGPRTSDPVAFKSIAACAMIKSLYQNNGFLLEITS